MTRYLCAAVNMDHSLSRKVIEDLLEHDHRAIAVTPGVDLVTVLRHALGANRRRLGRDAILFGLLLTLIGVLFFAGVSLWPLIVIIAGWVVIYIEEHVSMFGPAAQRLRPGRFDPDAAPTAGAGAVSDRQLQRIAAATEAGNVTLYGGFPPFVGYGRVQTSWSFAVDVTRPAGGRNPVAFAVQEVYDFVGDRLRALDLPGIEVGCRLFVNGQDIEDDPRFLPEPGAAPATSVPDDVVRALIAAPEERARPYLIVSMTGWDGDLVVTTFVRFLLSRTDLFVEAAHTAVPPLAARYKAIDEMEQSPSGREFAGMLSRTIMSGPGLVLSSAGRIMHELLSDSRRDKNNRRTRLKAEYGAMTSLREAAAEPNWQRYFQVFDNARYRKVIEQRIFRSLVEFLDAHDVDTTSLVARSETVINNGVMLTGQSTVNAAQVAVGAGAQAAGVLSRVRGGHGAG